MDKRPAILRDVRSAKRVPVIVVVFKRGLGIETDPVRLVTQYWSMDGCLLAECDPEQAPWLVREV